MNLAAIGGWTPTSAARRVRKVFPAALLAAAAAGIAWWFAHDVLGHTLPFFAPISAAVALSTSHVQRARRSSQMIVGVLLGIAVAELLHPSLGNGAVALGVIVLVTLLAAVAVGIGFVGEGLIFVNQAAASAILVITLNRAGAGTELATDALVGGAVAVIIGAGLFPADPLKLLWAAELRVLCALTRVLSRERLSVHPPADGEMDRALASSHEVHARLSELTQARSTARATVRVAPRRIPMRAAVELEERRVGRLYLLASGVMGLMRTVEDLAREGSAPSEVYGGQVDELSDLMGDLLMVARPWTGDGVAAVRARLDELIARQLPGGSAEEAVLATSVRRVAAELLCLLPVAR